MTGNELTISSGNYCLWRFKRICVLQHSVMTNFNCTCPAIQRGQGSGFLSEGSSWLIACKSGCAGSPEPSLLANAISTKFAWRGPFEPPRDKTNKMACAPREDSGQPGHLPSLIRVCCAPKAFLRTQAFFMRTAKTLIRLGGNPGWSES